MKQIAPLAFVFLSVWTVRSEQPTLGFDDKVPQPPREIVPAAAAVGMSLPPPPATSFAAAERSVFPESIRPRGTVRFDGGNGVGYSNGYTYLEGFLPLYEDVGRWLFFNNLRLVNYQNADLWEFNGGFGFARFNPYTARVLGVHAEYDGRTTLNDNYFNQMTVGWESLGPLIDVRNNFYVPVGTREAQIGQAATVFDPRFYQNNIIFSRNRFYEGTLGGLDFEAGGLLAGADRWNLRGYLGGYHYSGSGLRDIDGIRGRLEANVGNSLSLYFQVQNDAVNDTQVSGGVALFFGPGKASRGVPGATPYARMGERIVRDPNIVTGTQTKVVAEAALDVDTGKPIIVRHADSAATPGGDGTVEHPYQTLGQLQVGSTPRDILFVHANSVFANQSIALQDQQRFLGEGLNYVFASKQGVFLLPRATNGTLLPVIQNSAGDMVTLANRVEVAGFQLNGAGRDAIVGNSVSDVYLHDFAIAAAGGNGIRFVNVGGTNNIDNVSIAGVGGSGISMELFGGTASTNFFRNIAIANAAGNGIDLRTYDSSRTQLSVSDSSIAGAGRDGVDIHLRDASQAQVDLSNNTIVDAGRDGVNVHASGSSLGQIDLSNNTITDAKRNGVDIRLRGSSQGQVDVANNAIADAGRNGIDLRLRGSSQGQVDLSSNAIDGAGRDGVRAVAEGSSALAASVAGNVIQESGRSGAFFTQRDQSAVTANVAANALKNNSQYQVAAYVNDQSKGNYTIVDNTMTGPSIVGVDIHTANAGRVSAQIANNAIDNGSFAGIHFDAIQKANVAATIANNTLAGGGSGLAFTLDDASTAAYSVAGNLISKTSHTGVYFTANGHSGATVVLDDNTIRDSGGYGLSFLQNDRSSIAAQIVGNTLFANRLGQIRIDMAGSSTGTYDIANNSLRGTGGSGVLAFLSNKASADLTLSDNSISRSFRGGVRVDVADQTNLNTLFERNQIFENLSGGVSFIQYDHATVNARLANNQIFDNALANVSIQTRDRSFGAYQLVSNTLQGGLASSVFADSQNKSTLHMQLFGNTINRPVVLIENPGSNFRLEKTLATNTVTFPGFFFIDPSIFPLAPSGSLGFPPP